MIIAVLLGTAVDVSFFVRIKGKYWGLAVSPYALFPSSPHCEPYTKSTDKDNFCIAQK